MAANGSRRLGSWVIPLASIVILICILASSWITYDRVRTVLDTKDWVSHTWEVKASVERVYGLIVTAESDVRAYVLSKNEPSFKRYLGAKAAVDRQIAHIRELTRDNPHQAINLDRLRTSVDGRFRIMQQAVDARESRGVEQTVAFLNVGSVKGRGVRAMDEVRRRISALVRQEDDLLAKRVERSRGQTVEAELSFVFSTLLGVALISAFAGLSSRLVAVRDRAAHKERVLRGDLEREFERTRAAEIRLEATLVELRRSNEELQNFAFVASHDLQEPLRKIRAFSDRVRRRSEGALDEESRDSLRRVEAAADRMQRLILDLLELSRITTKNRPHLRVEPAETLAEVVDDLQARIDETGGRVVYGTLPPVVVDPAQLRQLFQNLVANALKFRREGVVPEVRIEGEPRPDGRVAFALHDNGIGFEAKYADRIFVVFQRLHGRGEYEGSGIGLAIVRKIVERHGGSIAAEGRPGEGATFRFDLPGTEPPGSADAILPRVETE